MTVAAACTPTPTPNRPGHDRGYRLGGLVVTGAPAVDPQIARELAPYAMPSVRLLDIAQDGHRALIVRGGALWEVDDAHGAPIRHMARHEVAWARFVDGGDIIATADLDGDEVFELYREGRTSASRSVRIGIAQHTNVVIDQARTRLAWAAGNRIAAGRKPSPFDDLEVVWGSPLVWPSSGSVPTGSVTMTSLDPGGAWAPLDIAGDLVLAKRVRSSWRSDLFALRGDVATLLDQLHAHDDRGGDASSIVHATQLGDRGNTPAAVLARRPDGSASNLVYAIMDRGGDHLGVWRLDVTGAREPVALTAEIPWDITSLAISGDGRTLAFVSNEDARSVLHLLDTDTGQHRIAPGASTTGVIADVHFAANANVLALSYGDATHARDAYRYDVDRGALVAWLPRESAHDLADSDRVRIPSSSGVTVPAFVYRPRATRDATNRRPVVIKLHGGPEDQWLPRYDGFDQFLVARGWTILAPDVRGSTGYGNAYAHLDDLDKRGNVLDDIAAVLDWIARQPDLDATHVVIEGASYGGYLAAMATFRFGDRLRAAIILGGIADMPRFLATTSVSRQAERRAEYGDERRVRGMLERLSPSTHVDAIHRPMLIAHGQRDTRVVISSTDDLVAASRAHGNEVWYLRADDEGHVFSRTSNRGVLQVLIAQFLGRVINEP